MLFGIFGVLNYPIYYLTWKYLALQTYENLWLRVIATLLCIPLILKNHWPYKLRTWLPTYWLLTLLFCLPFFFTFMLFKNNAADVWLMSTTVVLVWLMLLVDWLSFIVLLVIGVSTAWLFYKLTTNVPFEKTNFLGLAAQYVGSLAVVLIFAHNGERLKKEKLQTIKTIGASMAHELRTPLRSIHSAAHGIKNYFPKLLETYQLAKKANLPVPRISHNHYETLLTACDHIESETDEAFTIVDMLLMNVSESINTRDFKACSIHECVDQAIRRYPYDIGEAELVHWKDENDFLFKGNELLIIHVFFNLMKNSFYQIKATHKGEIHIWTERVGKYNLLHFKDTAKGISPKVLPHIFERFYTKTYHGTGVGLAFCKLVMENLGGKITSQSIEGQYAEFILYFPYDPTLSKAENQPDQGNNGIDMGD